MRRSRTSVSQIVFWVLSLLVVLSMILGLALSVMPQPSPSVPTPPPLPFLFAVSGESASNMEAYSRLLERVADDGNFFLVHTGNLGADGSEPGYREFASIMADFPLPFYPVPGDHDYYDGTPDNFLQYSGAPDVHYSFDYGLVHFTVTNSKLGEMAAEELEWLKTDLSASERPVKMVFVHYPPFEVAGNTDVMESGGEAFVALVEKLGVSYVFYGHIQGYHAEERNGVRYINGGPNMSQTDGSEWVGLPQYLRVDVEGTEVSVEVVPIQE